jgi:hypothetical protein
MKTPAVLFSNNPVPRDQQTEPGFRAVKIVRKGRLAVAAPVEPSEPLSAETVRRTQMELRAERGKI